MKRYFLLGLIAALSAEASFGAVVHQGSASVRIEKLLAEKQAKLKKLESCKGTTKNLKIAGLSTLGITAAGVVVNVAEAVELNKQEKNLQTAKQQHDTALEKNKEIVKAQEEDSFKNWCGGQSGGAYNSVNKSCVISQQDNNVTDATQAEQKINTIVVDTCGSVSEGDNNTYSATCKKDGHDVSVTITGKAANAQSVQQKSKEAKADGSTSEEGVAAKEEPAEAKKEGAEAPAGATGNAEEQFKTACEKLKKDLSLNVDAGTAAGEQYCRVDLSKQGINGDANRKAKVKDLATMLEGVTCDSTKIVPHTTDTNQMVMNCDATTDKYNRFFVRFGASAIPVANKDGLDADFAKKCRNQGGSIVEKKTKIGEIYYLCSISASANVRTPEQATQKFTEIYAAFGCSKTDNSPYVSVGAPTSVEKDCIESAGASGNKKAVYWHAVGVKFATSICPVPGQQHISVDSNSTISCKCPDGQELKSGATSCTCSESGEAFMPGKRECVANADPTYYIENGYWKKCGANQTANGDKNGCECDTGFGLKDSTSGQCVQCGKGSQCYVDTTSKVATFCAPQGKVLNGAGTDCECPSGKGEDSNGKCIDCNETANNGYIDANNKCHICAVGEKPNQNTKTCDTASGN